MFALVLSPISKAYAKPQRTENKCDSAESVGPCERLPLNRVPKRSAFRSEETDALEPPFEGVTRNSESLSSTALMTIRGSERS